jgi:hypothetical protein
VGDVPRAPGTPLTPVPAARRQRRSRPRPQASRGDSHRAPGIADGAAADRRGPIVGARVGDGVPRLLGGGRPRGRRGARGGDRETEDPEAQQSTGGPRRSHDCRS